MPFQVSLSKERFKFSSTHFTIFNQEEAERLHGHNYLVSVDFDFRSLAEDTGLSAEFGLLKNKIDAICEELDERVLLPADSPFLEMGETETNIEVKFNEKFYSFPKEDCVILDMVNVSSECLAKWVYQELEQDLNAIIGLESFSVTIEETNGQAVTYVSEL
jgi:6-pyruvoyltetrahydropterin/6-carboxytetrahydropterin synthase